MSSVTLVKEQPVKEMLMLHLISQQLWKLPLFSSGKKASVETLSFLFIKSSSDFFWCSLRQLLLLVEYTKLFFLS